MTETNANEAACSTQSAAETSDACIEVNIKTLDSHVYTFRVKRNISILSVKEQIASAVGVPAEQQRLIFRGKALKDDHILSDYHVDDGHTMHLVVRHPVESQPPAGSGSAATASGNVEQQGRERAAVGSHNRIGQVPHSVVIGTVNVSDQVESILPEISRIIGTVLSSFGLGNLSAANVGGSNQPPSTTNNAFGQVPASGERDGWHANSDGRGEGGNQVPPGPTPSNVTFQSLPQSFQLLSGVTTLPSQPMVIPDSLITLSEFTRRMELILSQNGIHNQSPSASTLGNAQPSDNSAARRLPTSESLASVIRRIQQLLGGQAVATFSNIAGRLEGQGGITDTVLRNQIQAEAAHVGVVMQHLGALLLELGRTILTLRMGPSPAESIVNPGPAIYISRHGPNPLMVQTLPFQTGSLSSANSAIPVHVPASSLGQVSPLDISSNMNILMHAGTSRAAGEVSCTEPHTSEQASTNRAGSGNSRDRGSAPISPTRTVVAAVPPRPTEATNPVVSLFIPIYARPQQTTTNQSIPAQGPTTTTGAGLGTGASTDPPEQHSQVVVIPTVTAQVQMHIRGVDGSDINSGSHLVESMLSSDVAQSTERLQDLEGSSPLGSSRYGSSDRDADVVKPAGGTEVPLGPGSREQVSQTSTRPHHIELPTMNQSNSSANVDGIVSSVTQTSMSSQEEPAAETIQNKSDIRSMEKGNSFGLGNASTSNQAESCGKLAPLGLGLGGLQPSPSRRRSRPVKPQVDGHSSSSRPASQSQDAIARGQSILQSLVSQGRSGRTGVQASGSSVQPPSLVGQILHSVSSEGSAGSGQIDVTSIMSEVLHHPQLNGVLSGLSEQAGGASPDVLRNMMDQFYSSLGRNAFEQVVQQVENRDIERNISGLGSGQGIDFSRIVRQMLPVVSKALGNISTQPPDFRGTSTGSQPAVFDPQSQLMKNRLDELESQIDMKDATRQIESSSPTGAFRALVDTATRLSGIEARGPGFIEELCADEELVNEFVQMLYRSLHRRLESERGSEDKS